MHHASCIMNQASRILHHASCIAVRKLRFGMFTTLKINQGVMVGGRRPSMEENLWWKTTFGGRQPSVEDNLQWKRTFSGRHGSTTMKLYCHPSIFNYAVQVNLYLPHRVYLF